MVKAWSRKCFAPVGLIYLGNVDGIENEKQGEKCGTESLDGDLHVAEREKVYIGLSTRAFLNFGFGLI